MTTYILPISIGLIYYGIVYSAARVVSSSPECEVGSFNQPLGPLQPQQPCDYNKIVLTNLIFSVTCGVVAILAYIFLREKSQPIALGLGFGGVLVLLSDIMSSSYNVSGRDRLAIFMTAFIVVAIAILSFGRGYSWV
jgi:hypothetical protein